LCIDLQPLRARDAPPLEAPHESLSLPTAAAPEERELGEGGRNTSLLRGDPKEARLLCISKSAKEKESKGSDE